MNIAGFAKNLSDDGGFAFEVQLSITGKGQYVVAYGLSCKKDCHELHTTDPRRTIPHPIPIPPLIPDLKRIDEFLREFITG